MSTLRTKAEAELMKAGAVSYLDALVAIREFQRLVQMRSRNVVEPKLKELAAKMGRNRDQFRIEDYIHPPTKNDGIQAWVAVKVSCGDFDHFFGLRFKRNSDDKCIPLVVSSLENKQAFSCFSNRIYADEETKDYYSIEFHKEISPDDVDEFEKHLESLIDKWIEVWGKFGGVENLRSST